MDIFGCEIELLPTEVKEEKGKPRGRPKTKEYDTLMARIPQDMADRVKQYAALRHQSISAVIREGLLLLLRRKTVDDRLDERRYS